ncbi:cytochrome c oxidase subunit II [Pseudoroseicyclus tamaricis]|nr:cytochrome B [Pseudoroseicyclus tamaricis]
MLAGATAIFAMVAILITLAFRRGRRAEGKDEARSVRVWILGLGLGFSMTILAALLGFGLFIGERLLPRGGEEVVTVGAEGRQWAWTFRYEGRAPTEDVLHIPAGRPVDVAVTTTDVIHSFWIPRLAGKLDAIPGHTNILRIEADSPGTFAGLSAEYSGPGYDSFSFSVVAHGPAEWDAFLAGQTE